MNTCACNSEVWIHWPSPELSRSSSATRMPCAASRPAHRSATGMPTRTGPVARQAGHRHQAAHALRDLIEARPLGIRPVLAEAGDAGEHDARIDRPEVGVGDPEPVLDVGAEVLDHYVGALDQAQQDVPPFRRLEVQGQAPLVAVQVLEVRSGARAAEPVAVRALIGQLDLDHVGAPVGELAHAGRAGAHARQVDHGEARQRLARGQMGHGGLPHNSGQPR